MVRSVEMMRSAGRVRLQPQQAGSRVNLVCRVSRACGATDGVKSGPSKRARLHRTDGFRALAVIPSQVDVTSFGASSSASLADFSRPRPSALGLSPGAKTDIVQIALSRHFDSVSIRVAPPWHVSLERGLCIADKGANEVAAELSLSSSRYRSCSVLFRVRVCASTG